MTVKELKAFLADKPDEMPVVNPTYLGDDTYAPTDAEVRRLNETARSDRFERVGEGGFEAVVIF